MAQLSPPPPTSADDVPAELEGLRMTRQRKEVYAVLMDSTDHPTAQEVFLRSKDRMPSISLATVYNCLEALVGNAIVNQVNIDRSPSRYCANREEHVHLQHETTGEIVDIVLKPGVRLEDLFDLPQGTQISGVDITLKGTFPTNHS